MLLQLEMKGVTTGSEDLSLLWVWGSVREWLHGEFAQRAEHQEGVFLQNVGEASGAVGPLQGLGILSHRKCIVSGQQQVRDD